MIDPKRLHANKRVINLLTFIFHNHFVEMAEIGQDKKLFVTPQQFFDWMEAHVYLLQTADLVDTFNAAHPDRPVDYDDLEYVIELAESGHGVALLGCLWYEVLLGDRPPHKHQVETINMFMLVTWADGTASPLQAVLTRKMVEDQGGVMSDAVAASLAIGFLVGTYVNECVANGLDDLHDKGYNLSAPPGEPDPYHVMCGSVLNVLGQLQSPELAKRVRECLVLSQRLLRPPTKAWESQIKGQQPPQADPGAGGPESGGTGGWST